MLKFRPKLQKFLILLLTKFNEYEIILKDFGGDMITVEEYIKLREQPIETLANELLLGSKATVQAYHVLLRSYNMYNHYNFRKLVKKENVPFPKELQLDYGIQNGDGQSELENKRSQYLTNLEKEYDEDCQDDMIITIGDIHPKCFAKETYIVLPRTIGCVLIDYYDDLMKLRGFGIGALEEINKILIRYLKIEDRDPSLGSDLKKNSKGVFGSSIDIIRQAIGELEEQRKQHENNLFYELKDKGIAVLEDEPNESFKQNCDRFNFISQCVEEYLNDLSKQMLKDKKSKTEIAQTIQAKMDEFKALVQRKRDELEFGSEGAGFLSQMAAKISEVRKYKRKPKTTDPMLRKEGHEYNPFYNDGDLL